MRCTEYIQKKASTQWMNRTNAELNKNRLIRNRVKDDANRI